MKRIIFLSGMLLLSSQAFAEPDGVPERAPSLNDGVVSITTLPAEKAPSLNSQGGYGSALSEEEGTNLQEIGERPEPNAGHRGSIKEHGKFNKNSHHRHHAGRVDREGKNPTHYEAAK